MCWMTRYSCYEYKHPTLLLLLPNSFLDVLQLWPHRSCSCILNKTVKTLMREIVSILYMNHRNCFTGCMGFHRKSHSNTPGDQGNTAQAKWDLCNFTAEYHRCISPRAPCRKITGISWWFFYRVTFITGPRCERAASGSALCWPTETPLYKVLRCLDTHAVSAKGAFTPSRGARGCVFFVREPVVGERKKKNPVSVL